MGNRFRSGLLSLALLFVTFTTSYTQASSGNGCEIKSATFLSPKFVLGPGSVQNRNYYNIEFPRGHIALKSFNAEVVDEAGNPVPLHETYLHHWVLERYYQRQDLEIPENTRKREVDRFGNSFPRHLHDDEVGTKNTDKQKLDQLDRISGRNSGICQGRVLGQYFGLGSETRKTATHVPDPYGIEIGNPAEIPKGYDERWMLNIHAIDTRGVEDRLGCTECRCDLYNVTVDEYGRPLKPGYEGGLFCCYDLAQCRLRQGFEGARRSLYLRYTVKWVDWDSSIIPVKIYIFDVTDTGKRLNGSTGYASENGCQVEYDVESCSSNGAADGDSVDVKSTSLAMPIGGDVIYGVAHQHTGGLGSTLYGEDGRVICTSVPTYGEGKEAGNEAGYIVGMSTCYPEPGSVKISLGENLILESNYSRSTRAHTGVMGLFYLLVADQTPEHIPSLHGHVQTRNHTKDIVYVGSAAVLLGLVAVGVRSWLKKGRKEDGYQPILP